MIHSLTQLELPIHIHWLLIFQAKKISLKEYQLLTLQMNLQQALSVIGQLVQRIKNTERERRNEKSTKNVTLTKQKIVGKQSQVTREKESVQEFKQSQIIL